MYGLHAAWEVSPGRTSAWGSAGLAYLTAPSPRQTSPDVFQELQFIGCSTCEKPSSLLLFLSLDFNLLSLGLGCQHAARAAELALCTAVAHSSHQPALCGVGGSCGPRQDRRSAGRALWWEQRFGDEQLNRLSGEKACFVNDTSQGSMVSVASLAHAVSYSSVRRNVISTLFPFRNRMCKMFGHFPSPSIVSFSFLVIQCSHSWELHHLWKMAAVDPCS